MRAYYGHYVELLPGLPPWPIPRVSGNLSAQFVRFASAGVPPSWVTLSAARANAWLDVRLAAGGL